MSPDLLFFLGGGGGVQDLTMSFRLISSISGVTLGAIV